MVDCALSALGVCLWIHGKTNGMRLLYTVAVFLNSFLLFLVQPLVAKRLLPIFGGSPLVWNTCLLFFQLVLLFGYLYAHLSFKWAGSKRQPWVHLVVVFAPLALLPIGLPLGLRQMYENALATNPHSWAAQPGLMLLLMLFVSVGLPFFALSGGAPVIQRWFSHTDDPRAHDPYFLYQASNLGSMLALLSYPLWFERTFGLENQSRWWSYGYAGLIVLLVGVVATILAKRQAVDKEAEVVDDSPAPSWHDRLMWMFLSAGPSALLLAVTAYMSTNVAPIPLLWVIPLALYLITFIIAFSAKPLLSPRVAAYFAGAFVIPVVISINVMKGLPVAYMAAIHLVSFFLVAFACHSQISATRPRASHLTEFYLWISAGGVVGGFFSAIVAPMAFNSLAEYPIAIVACFTAIGLSMRPKAAWIFDLVVPIAFGALVYCVAHFYSEGKNEYVWTVPVVVAMVAASLRTIRFAATVAAIVIALHFGVYEDTNLYAGRSFFGVHYVEAVNDGAIHRLMNGNTTHGTQHLHPSMRRTPTTYYSHGSGVGRAILALQARHELTKFAVVGLGAGTLAAYGQPGESLDFYEIDPDIELMARNPKYFTYVTDSQAKINVLLGDARLRLNEAAPGTYDLLALDAFASDAIPVHLLTTEAFKLYFKALKPSGVLVVHVSNRYLRLAPVVAAVAKDCGLEGLSGHDDFESGPRLVTDSRSWWVLVGRPAALTPFKSDPFWEPLHTSKKIRAWTDDYSNVLSAMIFFND